MAFAPCARQAQRSGRPAEWDRSSSDSHRAGTKENATNRVRCCEVSLSFLRLWFTRGAKAHHAMPLEGRPCRGTRGRAEVEAFREEGAAAQHPVCAGGRPPRILARRDAVIIAAVQIGRAHV